MEQIVVLYTGRRGGDGKPGESIVGPQGPGFNARGVWSGGSIYRPGDAVVDDGTVAAGINSLYIQRASAAESVSTIAPRNDSARWMEIGAADLSNVTGSIWRVYQIAHGFGSVGTPVGYSVSADRWVGASNKIGDETAVGVIREVISTDEFIVQTSGEITGLDPALIRPDGTAAYTPGKFYYVSRLRGRVTETPTEPAVGFVTNAILLATGPTSGVVLQWQQTPNVVGRRPVGFNEFYFDAAPGQTVFSGVDLDGNTLTYQVSDQNQVFVDGELITQFDGYTASDGLNVTLAAPAVGGERVVFRAIAEALQAIAPATALPADNISPLFNGVDRQFPLTVGGGNDVALGPAQNVILFLDGNAQEPFTDYRVVAGVNNTSDIEFTVPPAQGARFWAVVGTAVSNLSFIEVNTLLADTGTIQTLNFTSGIGNHLSLVSMTVSGTAGFNIASAQNLTATLATIGALSYTSATGTTLGVTGTATIGNAVVTTGTMGALTVTGATTLNTLTVNGAASFTTLTTSGTATLASAAVTGALTAGSAAVTGALTAGSATVAGTAEAATLRAATIRGPAAGGNIEALNFVVDEGVF
jgi:hypothetical protein